MLTNPKNQNLPFTPQKYITPPTATMSKRTTTKKENKKYKKRKSPNGELNGLILFDHDC